MKNIFISFIEEAILNEDYAGYIGGRIEVSFPKDIYPSHEIRFFTKRIKEFLDFRNKWDMKRISPEKLKYIEDTVNAEFYERRISS